MQLRTLAALGLLARLAFALDYTFVPIPGDDNIQTTLMNTFPTGTFTANNALATPFAISAAPGKCGPSGAAPCNFYDGFGLSGSGLSITLNVSVANPTDIYTLMNAFNPAIGQQLATITFLGTGGTRLTFALIGGQDIRDVHIAGFADTLNNGVAGVDAVNAFTCTVPTTCEDLSGAAPPGIYFIDEQHFSLGTAFIGQTLTQIVLTDTYNGSIPFLVGVTVGAGTAIPAITPGGVVSASAFGEFTSASPGSWIEIYGASLSADTRGWTVADFTGITAPTSLDGVSVTVGGKSAFIDYISPGQVNALLSSDTPTGNQPLIVTNGQQTSAPYNLTVNPIEAGLLAPPQFNIGGIQYAVAIFTDGAYALPTGAIAGLNSRPAKPGDVLTLYGVGFGPVVPDIPAGQLVQQLNMLSLPLQLSIGNVPASLLYQGLAPDFTGLYQFNVTVPSAAPGNAALTFTLNGVSGTQVLYLAVGQ